VKKAGIIAVDIGTSSLRAVLFDQSGQVHRVSQRESAPLFGDGGRVEQDPDTWLRLVPEVIHDCATAAPDHSLDVAALTLTAQRSSVIPVDSACKPLRPAFMWQDTRTEKLCSRMQERHRRVYEITGLRITPVFSAVKMTWLRENEPDIFRASYKMMGIQDFVIHDLTGAWVTDRSLASRTNLYNLRSADWDGEMLELFGVPRSMLCDLVDPGAVAGTLSTRAAARIGLPAGLPVISAGGDQQCAALGLGLVGPGRMIANTGTGSYLIAAADRPAADPGMGIGCNVAAVPGTFILEAGVVTSGSIYQWFRREFYRDPVPDAEKYKKIDEEAAASPAGAKGVLLLPHFKGRGSPAWNPAARGAFLNLTPEVGRGDMARAVLEGIALEIGENIETLEQLSTPAAAIEVSGGMTKSSLFNQIQADCYGRTVERQDDAEATALGAWTSAAVRLGFYPSFETAIGTALKDTPRERFLPDPERNAVYRRAAEERKRLYAGMAQGR